MLIGTAANDIHFQAFLIEGIVRWNSARAEAATDSSTITVYRSFDTSLQDQLHSLSSRVIGAPIKPLWHLRDRGILFDGNILTNYNFSSKIRGRMDVCYVSYLYFRAEIANYIENLYFVGGKLCKNIANNQKY